MNINVAIDGPAGSGKSTLSRAVAQKMGYIYVDTGALYRAVGLKLISLNCTSDDENEVAEILKTTKVEIKFINNEQKVFCDGNDVTDKIRTPEVSMMASKCSALPVVRAFLLDMQRSIAKSNSVIMDGRDISTVVLPNADIKIFLTASVEVRAKRRYEELLEKGQKVDYNDVYEDIKVRDYNDSHRKIAPLKPSDESIIFDTSDYSLEENTERLYNLVKSFVKE